MIQHLSVSSIPPRPLKLRDEAPDRSPFGSSKVEEGAVTPLVPATSIPSTSEDRTTRTDLATACEGLGHGLKGGLVTSTNGPRR